MTDKLLPCPFCGGEALIIHFTQDACYVKCENHDCMAGQKVYDTKAEAIAAWNARADYHGFEQAAIEAWESIKAWNARADTEYGWSVPATDENMAKYGWGARADVPQLGRPQGCTEFVCSECGAHYLGFRFNYCPGCGARIEVGE